MIKESHSIKLKSSEPSVM